MSYNYTFKDFDKDNMARAVGVSLPVSMKHSIEVCNFIRQKTVEEAKQVLQKVADKKQAIPYRRFNRDLGHKTKIGMGRYPIKTSIEIKKVLEAAEANAQFKGLNTSSMIIKHISVQQAPNAWRYGRQRRRKTKRANVEVVVQETKKSKEKKVEKKAKPVQAEKHTPKEKKLEKPVRSAEASPKTEEKPKIEKAAPKKEVKEEKK